MPGSNLCVCVNCRLLGLLGVPGDKGWVHSLDLAAPLASGLLPGPGRLSSPEQFHRVDVFAAWSVVRPISVRCSVPTSRPASGSLTRFRSVLGVGSDRIGALLYSLEVKDASFSSSLFLCLCPTGAPSFSSSGGPSVCGIGTRSRRNSSDLINPGAALLEGRQDRFVYIHTRALYFHFGFFAYRSISCGSYTYAYARSNFTKASPSAILVWSSYTYTCILTYIRTASRSGLEYPGAIRRRVGVFIVPAPRPATRSPSSLVLVGVGSLEPCSTVSRSNAFVVRVYS